MYSRNGDETFHSWKDQLTGRYLNTGISRLMKEIRVGRPCNAKHWNVCNPETRYATLLWISSCQNTDSGMWVPPRLKNGNCFKSVWCPLPVPDDAKTGMRKPECENLPGVFDAKPAECEVREPGTPPCFGFCITKSTGSGMYWVSRNLVFGNWFWCDRTYHLCSCPHEKRPSQTKGLHARPIQT